MTRWAFLALALLACAGLARTAPAATIFTANMTASQEVPADPNMPVVSDASGTATFTLNDAETELAYEIHIFGLDFGLQNTPLDTSDDITGLHIHEAPAGQNGAVIFGMFGPSHDANFLVAFPGGGELVFTGIWDATDVAAETLASHLEDLKTKRLYANAHTVTYPSGEIRGQIVPEPATLSLLGTGLLLLAAARRRGPL